MVIHFAVQYLQELIVTSTCLIYCLWSILTYGLMADKYKNVTLFINFCLFFISSRRVNVALLLCHPVPIEIRACTAVPSAVISDTGDYYATKDATRPRDQHVDYGGAGDASAHGSNVSWRVQMCPPWAQSQGHMSRWPRGLGSDRTWTSATRDNLPVSMKWK